MTKEVTPQESLNRYRRQTAFAPFGERGQRRLGEAHCLIVGCGALGGSMAMLLARAGIGRLTLVDDDTVSVDNLHRQLAFVERDAEMRRKKVVAAKETLLSAAAATEVVAIDQRFDESNAVSLVTEADIVLDGCDNFPTRFLINRTAIRCRKPLISGGVAGARGQVMTVLPGRTACLACLLGDEHTPRSSETIDSVGVISPVVQIIASLQVTETLKFFAGVFEKNLPPLYTVDLWPSTLEHATTFRAHQIPYIPCDVCCEVSLRG
ncbi:MAG: HesA/MoeB/ThiF family protein [Thermoguttaceae bacterium]